MKTRARVQASRARPPGELSAGSPSRRIQCHFISNTHWDREWRYSAERTRLMLDYLMSMLFDIMRREPRFRHFHLDSQTLPIQDYLEVNPEKARVVRKYVRRGRLAIGPWFCLPDEYCVGGESLIRNLLLGHRIARAFGGVSKTGYSPFGWGQISQMPQLYAGFGIDMASFYRGVNPTMSRSSEFIWEGPDGTRILASRLGVRPRYNVWYVVQRPAYWRQEDVDARVVPWASGNGPFRFVDASRRDLDYQYTHPVFGYAMESIPRAAVRAIAEQDDDWSTPHRFWSDGHDSSCPDIRETRMIADCGRALGETARVFHSTIAAWQDGVKASVDRETLPVLRGEMREPASSKSVSGLLGWILSSRTSIKQENFSAERDLITIAEPLAVCATLTGAPYPGPFVARAYNFLLQNHGHDSIGACGRDVVIEDVRCRFRQSREVSACLVERAFMDIAGDIDLAARSPREIAVVAFNPLPFTRSEVQEIAVEAPEEWGAEVHLVDEAGDVVSSQRSVEPRPFASVVQSPNDVPNTMRSLRHLLRVRLYDVPGMGYRTWLAVAGAPGRTERATMCSGPREMQNEHLRVLVNPNGTLDVTEKAGGRTYQGLGYFRDRGEVGNPWQRMAPRADAEYTTREAAAEVTRLHDGAVEASYRVTIHWALPKSRCDGDAARSRELAPYPIVNTVTLRAGEPWVEVRTEVDNTVEDHYLQVSFPTTIGASVIRAQGQFDVVSRPAISRGRTATYEPPMSEHPMNSFVDVSDGAAGIALLNEGLKAYEPHDDAEHTLSLTLLRCYPLRICVTSDMLDYSELDRGSQCLGKHSFRYAVMPHRGDWEAGGVWQASERFNAPFVAAQIGPSRHGKNPTRMSFLELAREDLHLSALKRSEDGKGWIVRLFNPSDAACRNAVRLNGGHTGPSKPQTPVERVKAEFALPRTRGRLWRRVLEVSLEEIPRRRLDVDRDGWVQLEIPGKRIMSLKFIPR